MSSPKIDQSLNFLRLNWPIVTVIFAGLIAWGTAMADIAQLKSAQQQRSEDHDRIVRMEAVVDQSSKVIDEVRKEQKAQQEDIQNLEKTINSNFTELLVELRKERN